MHPRFWLRLVLVCLALLVMPMTFPGTARAQSDHGCATSGAVPDAATNAALVVDCETLLGLKDTLRGWAPLDWDVETPIWQWEGVAVSTVDGVERVASLSLRRPLHNSGVAFGAGFWAGKDSLWSLPAA